MQFITNPFRIIFATGTLLMLAACGGAPSDGDIKAAMEKQMEAEVEGLATIVGKQGVDRAKSLLPEIKSIKKIGCKEDGENAYKCDVEMEVTHMGNTNKGIAPIRFVKGSDGWVASK